MINAKPIWLYGKSEEKNTFAVLRLKKPIPKNSTLHIATSGFYRVYANGEFLAFGPARTARGYVREDVISLDSVNELVIEAAGYYCRSLSTVFEKSFIMAEVCHDGKLLYCADSDFELFSPKTKISNTERFSMQRHFTEVWDLRNDYFLAATPQTVDVDVKVIDRVAPYPLYEDIDLTLASKTGSFVFDESLEYKSKRYSWTQSDWGVFDTDEVDYQPFEWVQRQNKTVKSKNLSLPITLNAGEFAVFDFGRIEAGFIKTELLSNAESDLVIGFSEYFEEGCFGFSNINMHSVIEYLTKKGESYKLQSFEPYTFRYVIVMVKEGSIDLSLVGTKTYMFDISNIDYPAYENKTLTDIYRAAVRTFAHNAVDLYSDCPSRERAGWLCDSYFTAKTEYALTGKTGVEDAFLQNFMLFDGDKFYPEVPLPECYPADVCKGGEFIPQWTMWYIIELEEYVNKRGHCDIAENFKPSVYRLLEFYKKYENSDGLLEKLPSWNFVEWSIANSWTNDVNYPTNFLYAKTLESISLLYGDKQCEKRAKEVRNVAVLQSFNGRYFMDHAIRDDSGKLVLQPHASEAGQYYAVLFSGIDINSDKYSYLKDLIINVFTPKRECMPEIFKVNAFIGAYLRLETLLKMEEYDILLSDIEGFFGKMTERTGTLWEYREFKGSHDHGFASYALVAIKKALEK